MTAIFIQLTRDLYVIRLKHFSASSLFEIYDTRQPQPPPQALRFWQGRGERLVMSRRGPWEGYRRQAKHARCLLPAFLCARGIPKYPK